MHRSAARRLLHYSFFLSSSATSRANPSIRIPTPRVPFPYGFRFLSSSSEPSSSSSSSSSFNINNNDFNATLKDGERIHHSFNNDNNGNGSESDSSRGKRSAPRATYEEEQAKVITASLQHVIRLGWTEAAMIAGARDVGVSPSIVGSIPRKEAALVEYFMDECLQKLIDTIDSDELKLQDLVPSERIAKLIKFRLQMQAPYISKWPQALSVQANPTNISTSFKQRAMLVDEFLHAANDEGTGVDWYLKRTVVGGMYSATEIYMLTDNSTDFEDTWKFLNERVRDAFDLKKTYQEVKYFAEAVGAGLSQGFTKKGF